MNPPKTASVKRSLLLVSSSRTARETGAGAARSRYVQPQNKIVRSARPRHAKKARSLTGSELERNDGSYEIQLEKTVHRLIDPFCTCYNIASAAD